MRSFNRVAALGLFGLALAGCEDERPPLGTGTCNSWEAQVADVAAESCVSCHGADDPAAGYALDDYLAAVAADDGGERRVRPGDPESPILTIFDADEVHGDLAELRPVFERWVIACDARLITSEIHAPGIQYPPSDDFHAQLIRDVRYDLDQCTECHGEDFGGGTSEASCLGCHPAGPTDCQTCHSELQDSRPHQVHLMGGDLQYPVDCNVCHDVPDDLHSPGHVLTASGELDPPPVEVRLIGPAVPPTGTATPTYDHETMTCDGVYCHSVSEPRWVADAGPLGCDGCHGFPPPDHPGEDCEHCHKPTVNEMNEIADFALHIDREVQLGDPALGCGGCHGTPENPAPAPDLDGRFDETFVTVGAHQQHLFPQLGLATPTECSECHLVPDDVRSPGHLDPLPAEVFPDAPGVADLASANGATPTWDRETATCSDVYCHGLGDLLEDDMSPGLLQNPVWNAPRLQQAYCGSCHGVPPTTPIHASVEGIDRCADCHVGTVDQFGNILFTGEPGNETSEHIDGQIFD